MCIHHRTNSDEASVHPCPKENLASPYCDRLQPETTTQKHICKQNNRYEGASFVCCLANRLPDARANLNEKSESLMLPPDFEFPRTIKPTFVEKPRGGQAGNVKYRFVKKFLKSKYSRPVRTRRTQTSRNRDHNLEALRTSTKKLASKIFKVMQLEFSDHWFLCQTKTSKQSDPTHSKPRSLLSSLLFRKFSSIIKKWGKFSSRFSYYCVYRLARNFENIFANFGFLSVLRLSFCNKCIDISHPSCLNTTIFRVRRKLNP